MPKFDRSKMYAVEGVFLQYVERVMQALYADKPISPDARRDMANGLDAHLTQNVTEM